MPPFEDSVEQVCELQNALSAAPVNPETTIPGTDDMDKRFAWLEAKAIDMGYVLVPEPEHPDSPHAAPVGELSLDDRQKAVVDWGVTAFGDETGRANRPLQFLAMISGDQPNWLKIQMTKEPTLEDHAVIAKAIIAALSAPDVSDETGRENASG